MANHSTRPCSASGQCSHPLPAPPLQTFWKASRKLPNGPSPNLARFFFAFVRSFSLPQSPPSNSFLPCSDKLTSLHLPCRPLNGPDLPSLLLVLRPTTLAPLYYLSLGLSRPLPRTLCFNSVDLQPYLFQSRLSSSTSFQFITSLDCLTCNHYFRRI